MAADDFISKKFMDVGGVKTRTSVWISDLQDPECQPIPITEEEAEILRGLDRYYD